MCRNIKNLYNFDPPATDEEIKNAALQFVRKVSGFRTPSKINEKAFDKAVTETSNVIQKLLNNLQTTASPLDREIEAQKAKLRSEKRFSIK
jgi:hypothetical protein